jgi:glucose-1-phosphate adenylyltransferase
MPNSAQAPRKPFAVLLAGGRGSRLHELTRSFCKPAVPFLGRTRIVDFVMENLLTSGLDQVLVATQYLPHGLEGHLDRTWASRLAPGALTIARGAEGPHPDMPTYAGTADAVWRNAAAIDASGAEEVLILSADHVYRMDYAPLIEAHRQSGAGITVAATVVTLEEATGFGVIEQAADGRIARFVEKPMNPQPLADLPGHAMASMGIYVCNWRWLREILAADAEHAASSHDFGKDLLPAAVAAGKAHAWLWQADAGATTFWRDVGTLDSLRETIMEFTGPRAPFVLPSSDQRRLVARRMAEGWDWRHPAAPKRETRLAGTVLMPGAEVPENCRLSRAIVAPFAKLPQGLVVGEDPEEDARWFRVSEGGSVLITAEMAEKRAAKSRGVFGWLRTAV